MLKLDYTIEDPQERNKLVQKIIDETPELNEHYLEILADYLILGIERKERREKKIRALFNNRSVTIAKHETSLEGLVAQMENGEDSLYNLTPPEPNKTQIFAPKVKITKQDLIDIPYLTVLRDAIASLETKLRKADGRAKYVIKQTIIDLRKDQYIIKNAYKPPIQFAQTTKTSFPRVYPESYSITDEGAIQATGISFYRPEICSIILQYYSKLKNSSIGRFDSDLWATMHDFDILLEKALADFPLYRTIVDLKIKGYQNIEIQEVLEEKFGIKHSLEYISSLWRNKIPGLLASQAEDSFFDWYYLNIEKGTYKRCSRCGQVKLAHSKYFSKNKTSKDGWYSICKKCRNSRNRLKKETELNGR